MGGLGHDVEHCEGEPVLLLWGEVAEHGIGGVDEVDGRGPGILSSVEVLDERLEEDWPKELDEGEEPLHANDIEHVIFEDAHQGPDERVGLCSILSSLSKVILESLYHAVDLIFFSDVSVELELELVVLPHVVDEGSDPVEEQVAEGSCLLVGDSSLKELLLLSWYSWLLFTRLDLLTSSVGLCVLRE